MTFLLTDVEGSSRLWEADPQAASAAMARRLAIIEDATRRHGGRCPLEQGEGDSSVSVFVRATDAAACALDVQRAMGAEPWATMHPVRVRIALHTGEPDVWSDGTYQGPVLNRCARLRSAAHGGQILLSEATYALVVDALRDGLGVRDLGTLRLRDLGRPERVWQLTHRDIPDAFPPLRSGSVANNLPTQTTSFVGRGSAIEDIVERLGEVRMLTLVGAGGSGKTRLAIQVATMVADRHPDGVWWVDLAPLADPALVAAALASALGVRESPVEPITDTLVRYLAPHRALLMLDNCEHLIDSCAELAARLIARCADVTLMATSREPLRVAGEITWPVPPLSLPQDEQGVDCEAVQLFVDRARAAEPRFNLEGNDAAVVQICRRLDGIPLAIELAAARTRTLSVDEIAVALADRFQLLTGGARTALPRQRTLESSVDWSHDLLTDDERVVFRRVAAFAGPFTLDAAEAVCAGEDLPRQRVLDKVGALVDRSLVQVADERGARTRYRLLETILDYARHKLTDAGEAATTRDRHLDHYVSFAERARTELEGPALIAWLPRIDAELGNLRAALDWAPRSADPLRGARIVGALCLYWFARSELGIGRTRLEAALADATEGRSDRAEALCSLSMVAYRAGDMMSCLRFADEAIEIARAIGDPRSLAHALHLRGWACEWGIADHKAAWAAFGEAAALFRERNDAWRALNLGVWGWSYADSSEAARARPVLEEGLTLTDHTPAPHARCYCLIALGFVETLEGRFEDAATHLDEALVLAAEVSDHYADVCARLFRGWADIHRGRFEDARELCEGGLAIASKHRSPNCEGFMRHALGGAHLANGQLDDADREFDAAYASVGVNMPMFAALHPASRATSALARGDLDAASRYADEALALGQQTDAPLAITPATAVKGAVALSGGDAHRAEDLVHRSIDLAMRMGHRPELCDQLDALATAIAHQGRPDEAARLLGAAQHARDAMGYVRPPVVAASYDVVVNQVRDALGAEEFEVAVDVGAKLSLEDAVAYAKRGRGRRKRPSHGWNSLTPMELQVVDLVAGGLTNPQIGEKLLISKRTVQSHLASVFAKLDVSTRAELAAEFAVRRSTAT